MRSAAVSQCILVISLSAAVVGGLEVIEYWSRYYEGQDGLVSCECDVSVM